MADASDDRHPVAEALPDMPIKPGGIDALTDYDDIEDITLVRGFYAQDDGEPAATQVLVMVAVARVVALDFDLKAEQWTVLFDGVHDKDDIPNEYEDHRRPAVPYARDVLADQAPDMEALFGDRGIVPKSESESV